MSGSENGERGGAAGLDARPDLLRYVVTVDDPSTWTRPWTCEVPMQRNPDPIFEYACHEGDYSMAVILEGARNRDLAAEAKRAAVSGEGGDRCGIGLKTVGVRPWSWPKSGR